ncbi:MAG: glycosyltransferase [Actinomycetes bacterium]
MAGDERRRRRASGEVQPELTLIIPAYNEGDRIASGLIRLRAAAATGAIDLDTTEVLYVDDGSTDATTAAATEAALSLPNGRVITLPKNLGKGGAVRAGVAAAKGTNMAFCDADFSIDAKHLGEFVAALGDADVAIGSRATTHGAVEYGHKFRTLGGRLFNRLVNSITHLDLADTQCGMKAFRGDVARILFATTAIERFAFDVELLTRCRQFGFVVREVPVTWDEIAGSSVRPFADPYSMLKDLAKSQLGGQIRPLSGYRVVGATSAEQLRARIANVTASPQPVVIESARALLVVFPFATGPERSALGAHVLAALSPLKVSADAFTVKDLSRLSPLTVSQVPTTTK